MEKAFVFVPPADRKLQFEYFQLRRDPKMYTQSDRQVVQAFIFCRRVKTLSVGGLYSLIQI